MRSEDMVITCEESSLYFDLNGNFGLPTDEQSEVSATEKVTQDAPIEESQKPVSPGTNKITNQKATETTKPTNTEVYKRKPTNNKLKVTESNKHLNSGKKKDEEHKQIITNIEKAATTNIENKDTISIDEVESKPTNSEVLQDSSSETDIVSALIDSLTNDSEPTDDDDKKSEEEQLNNIDGKVQAIPNFPEVTKQEAVINTPIITNEVPLDYNTKKPSDNLIASLSIDDVIGLVKDSLDNNSKVSELDEKNEQIKPIYQRNEDAMNDNSKIIVITKPNEGTEPLVAESIDSKIIPLEIKEPKFESPDSVKTKSRRHLKLSSRVK